MMDAITLLKDDHERVKGMFAEYFELAAAQPERKRELARTILRELTVHERIEEEIFYPAFRETGKDAREETQHAKEEHLLVDSLIDHLTQLDLDDPKFDATFKLMRENVEHHIKDEEERMLPAAKRRIGTSKLQALGRDMMTYAEALKSQMATGASPQSDTRRAPSTGSASRTQERGGQ